jgi:hypothetical protein
MICVAAVGLAATLGGCLGVVDKALTPPAFYVADDHDLVGAPGTLIRQQPILDAPSGTTAYRLQIDRPRRKEHSPIGFYRDSERANPRRRPSRRRMGAPHQRGGSSLRAFGSVVEIRKRSGPQRHGEARLCWSSSTTETNDAVGISAPEVRAATPPHPHADGLAGAQE